MPPYFIVAAVLLQATTLDPTLALIIVVLAFVTITAMIVGLIIIGIVYGREDITQRLTDSLDKTVALFGHITTKKK